jgi:hypothetical protein
MSDAEFTDEEFAFLRHVRFGDLPDRIRPDDHVQLVESDPPKGRPEAALSEQQWDALRAGG